MSDDSYQLEKRAGEIIFREGDLADFAYIIENGRVQISVERDGRSVALAELGSGEILGEMAVIDRFNRTATATVTRDCRLTVVTPPQILQRVEEADPVVRSLIQILMKRYRAELTRAQGMPMEAASAFVSQSRGIQKIRLENELMRAIANEDVKVVYQPIRDLANGCTSGFEALVRWDHPTRGTIPPEELVSLAEETELIVPLGLHVFEVAAKDRSALAAVGSSELFVSVNVSPRHTLDGDFLERAKDICDKLGERPANIMLELTESVQADIQSLGAWVAAARAIGFQITVDDFGTGYASLEYLTRLAPDIGQDRPDFCQADRGGLAHGGGSAACVADGPGPGCAGHRGGRGIFGARPPADGAGLRHGSRLCHRQTRNLSSGDRANGRPVTCPPWWAPLWSAGSPRHSRRRLRIPSFVH